MTYINLFSNMVTLGTIATQDSDDVNISGGSITGTNLNTAISNISSSSIGAIPTAQKGAANGVARLDGTGKHFASESLPCNINYNSAQAIWTFTWADGSQQVVDQPIENLFQNAGYDPISQNLVLTTNGGGTINVPLAALVDLPEIVVANTNPATNPTTGQRLYLRYDTGEYWIAGLGVSAGTWQGKFLSLTLAERNKIAGLGTISTQNSDAVGITGGSISGVSVLNSAANVDGLFRTESNNQSSGTSARTDFVQMIGGSTTRSSIIGIRQIGGIDTGFWDARGNLPFEQRLSFAENVWLRYQRNATNIPSIQLGGETGCEIGINGASVANCKNTFGAESGKHTALFRSVTGALSNLMVWNVSNATVFQVTDTFVQVVPTLFANGSISMGPGNITPTGNLHLDYGNAIASRIKFTAGTTTGQTSNDGLDIGISTTGVAEIRQRENLGLEFYTNNTLRASISGAGVFTISNSLNVGGGSTLNSFRSASSSPTINVAAGATADVNFTVTGVAAGTTDCCVAAFTSAPPAGLIVEGAWSSAGNTVTVRFHNRSAVGINQAVPMRIGVMRF